MKYLSPKYKLTRKNRLIDILPNGLLLPFVFLSSLILILLVFTHFVQIPTESFNGTIGLGSNALNIGDRDFYLKAHLISNDSGIEKPSFLYPSILRFITFIVGLFGLNETSELWNFLVISIASFCSLATLFFTYDIAYELFGEKVAKISSWLFILCPYTLFFIISGSLTCYMSLGFSFCYWIIIKSHIFDDKSKTKINILKFSIQCSIGCIFLSSLRPSGSLFSILYLTLLSLYIFYKYNNNKYLFILIASIIYSLFQLNQSFAYITFAVSDFINEGGMFFGVERSFIRTMKITHYQYPYIIRKIHLSYIIKKN